MGSTTTKYLIDDLNPTGYAQILDELTSGSVNRFYAYGLQRISEDQLVGSTWTPSFYGYDGHGNVRFLANSAGAQTDSYTLDAFGMLIASTGTTANNFRYSGEWLDAEGPARTSDLIRQWILWAAYAVELGKDLLSPYFASVSYEVHRIGTCHFTCHCH